MNEHIVPEEQNGCRLDAFLSQNNPEISRAAFQKAIKAGEVSINGGDVLKPSHEVKTGDKVTLRDSVGITHLPTGKHIALDVLYEDEYVLVINKPAGLVVHPTGQEHTETIVHAVLHHDPSIAAALYDADSEISAMRPGIVHRLDKDTSGALVIAKTADSLHKLSDLFKQHKVEKQYLAIVSGIVKEKERIDTGIERKQSRHGRMGISVSADSRQAVTHVAPLASLNLHGQPATLIGCSIETGRTHQIRVHCKYRGYPVLGDEQYTNKTATNLSERAGASRQMLHARSLSFVHPFTGENMHIKAELPEDFKLVLTKLGAPDSLEARGYL